MRAGSYRPNERIRVAGIVTKDTIVHNGAVTSFTIQDGKATLPITTAALLPDTFTAGVTVVAEGSMTGGGGFPPPRGLAKCPSKFLAQVPTREGPCDGRRGRRAPPALPRRCLCP